MGYIPLWRNINGSTFPFIRVRQLSKWPPVISTSWYLILMTECNEGNRMSLQFGMCVKSQLPCCAMERLMQNGTVEGLQPRASKELKPLVQQPTWN